MNKPRLIDANEYLQKVCTYKETGCGSCKFQECCPKDQPTAYDVQGVVEQLEAIIPCNAKCAATHYGGLGCAACFIGRVIEIVKGGAE